MPSDNTSQQSLTVSHDALPCTILHPSNMPSVCNYIYLIIVQVALRVRPINMMEVGQDARYIAHVIDKQVRYSLTVCLHDSLLAIL